jgi:hypothetical protein
MNVLCDSERDDRCTVWEDVFDAETRRQLIEEDRLAGQIVVGILSCLVGVGLLMAIFSVLVIVC